MSGARSEELRAFARRFAGVFPPQVVSAALTEPDARAALSAMTELQLETVPPAPPGADVDRARCWLAEALVALRSAPAR